MASLPGSVRARIAIVAVAVVVVLVALAAVVWLSGDGGPDEATDAGDTTSTQPPVEEARTTTSTTEVADAEAKPASDPAIALDPVLEVDGPSAVADPPGDGPVLVSTLAGRVLAADLASGETEVVLDLTDDVSVGGERGLLGLAVDPDGERLYVNHTDPAGDTIVRSWALEDGRPTGSADAGVVHLALDQPYANHNGGHLAFGADGRLWIGTGDGGSSGDPDGNAQDPSSLLGKMLRMEPAAAGSGGELEIWGVGLRNPWRYSFDRETGQLWIADVGQTSTEEVSVIEPDATAPNFGWPLVEGDQPFAGEPDPAFVSPVVTYGHDQGCSITGGYVYRGEAVPSLHGWYLFGDYCGGFVRAVPADDPSAGAVELATDLGPVLSFAELEDGELLVLTDVGISRVAPSR